MVNRDRLISHRHQILQPIFILLLGGLLVACGMSTPPIGFAPDGEIITKAIALQLEQTEQQLSQQLNSPSPDLEINHVKVKELEPLYMGKLPTYHLFGNYDLTIQLPLQKVKQAQNTFEIYLQRQQEGKTWRLLKKEDDETEDYPIWRSYLVY